MPCLNALNCWRYSYRRYSGNGFGHHSLDVILGPPMDKLSKNWSFRAGLMKHHVSWKTIRLKKGAKNKWQSFLTKFPTKQSYFLQTWVLIISKCIQSAVNFNFCIFSDSDTFGKPPLVISPSYVLPNFKTFSKPQDILLTVLIPFQTSAVTFQQSLILFQ